LRLGRYVIVDQLGRGPHGTTFLARLPGSREQLVLKQLTVSDEALLECRARLNKLCEQTDGWSHPHVVIPRLLPAETPSQIVTVSRWVPGLTLGELLVRRGRFPSSVVVDLARQLASGLAPLHGRGLAHGDLRLSNIRLTTSGSAILVDGGIRPAVCPELTIHESLALDAYDGTAPELIGTGAGPDASSEIYALGCLLWQLLTGRPPYPMADSLMKLAAHQTQRIADVRIWAPDTAPHVADVIWSMTSPIPNERPRSFEELLQRWGRPGMASRSRIKRYRKTFDGAVPHFASPGEPVVHRRWPWAAAGLLIMSGGAFSLADAGLKSDALAITQRLLSTFQTKPSDAPSMATAQQATDAATGRVPAGRQANGLLPLPAPSANGEIILTEADVYDVADVAFAGGELKVQAAAGIHAVIRVGREPLRLAADSIKLMNVTLESDTSEAPALLLLRSRTAQFQDCYFHRTISSPATGKVDRPIVAWAPLEQSSTADPPNSRQIEFQNSVWHATGPAVWFAEAPATVRVNNCLKLGPGACFVISPKATPRNIAFQLERLSLRESGPLLRFGGRLAEQSEPIDLVATDCVFAIGSEEPNLIELQSAKPPADLRKSVRLNGNGSVIPAALTLMATIDSSRPHRSVAIDDADEQFEGIVASDLEFAGSWDGAPKNSQLIRMTAPRSSSAHAFPGVDAGKLPSRLNK
jgi:eukaryotic-like serine/threonine-protein kinase